MRSISSTGVPSAPRASAISSGGASIGANSRNQERRTFTPPSRSLWRRTACRCDVADARTRAGRASELLQEAEVVREQIAEVIDAVALLGEAVDAEAEREALP